MPSRPDRLRLLSLLCFAIALSGCTKFQLLDATIGRGGYVSTTDIPYGPLPRQKLDVYRPCHALSGGDVIIFFYGGDWQAGQKQDYRFVAQALASHGFLTILPDYRLYPCVTFPSFVEDGARAVRWTHDNASTFGGSASHVFLMGHSAGAHIAALLTLDARYLQTVGLDRSAIRATAGLSGPYDFTPWPGDRAVFSMKPGDTQLDPAAEPINFVDGREPPMLLVHGTADQTVSADNAVHLASRIRQAGGSVQCALYPGKSHVDVVLAFAWPFRWIAPTLRDTTEFFKQFDH
jgi:acetyl esterase/lipase